jgi:hypothetical protein
MTRSSLKRTLKFVYLVLFLVLAISIAAKFADRIPGIAGTPVERTAEDIYEYLRDMALVLVTVVAAFLASMLQKRSQFLGRLEEEWRGIVRTKSALYCFCENPNPTADDYLAAFCRISETLDNMRVVYANVGETDDLIGLYPFAPLHDMRRALQSIDPRKRSDITQEERKLARDAILQAFYALRENFLEELDLAEPDTPMTAAVSRRLKKPGVSAHGRRVEARQVATYRGHGAPRRDEVEALLWRLHAEEEHPR